MPKAYENAGVSVEAGYEVVKRIKSHVARTERPGVVGGIGGFGGLFDLASLGYREPMLISGTDGVGTKLVVAKMAGRHDTIGIDCVAMCVNDIAAQGAEPLFFLDYIACGKNDPGRIADIVAGVTEGCRQAGCALVGGETAEMPGFYAPEEYDLAGFSVGIVDKAKILDGSAMEEGDILLGLGSSGVHSNGFSLVRKVLGVDKKVLSTYSADLGCTIGEELIKPTRIYVKAVKALLQGGIAIRAISHITGGGLYENVPRMMKAGLTARIQISSVPVPPIFSLIAQAGNIPQRDMYNTFNMGVGMILAVPKDQVGAAVDLLTKIGERAYVVGSVVKGDNGVELV